MRILHLDAGREMRGGQWQVLRLIEGLSAAGVDCTLLARRGSLLFDYVRRKGYRVEDLGLMRTASEARRHDLVHAHDARGHTIGAIVPGSPLVVSRRVAFAVSRSAASQWKYRRATRYIAVSEYVKSVMMQAGVRQEKISVVHDGVPILAEREWQEGPGRVIAPANLSDPQKGASLAAEAARIAGVDLEFSTDLEHDLAHASLLLYVTHSEGLGSGALLAMSAGVPVVASRVGGLPEVIRDGENGILVDNQPEAIALAVRQLLDNPELARRMGAAARQTVIDRFSVDGMVRRTMEVYRQVLS
ncbi:MAG TPA: glycosyltransferase family 4 protein [Bryobacteraceae bacterium]|nr:glycosyltransferase family 4 protein [Bryobacteraceae bacterium]